MNSTENNKSNKMDEKKVEERLKEYDRQTKELAQNEIRKKLLEKFASAFMT